MKLRVQAHGVVQLHKTLTIITEIVEEIITAASHENGPLLVTSQAPCILNSLAQSISLENHMSVWQMMMLRGSCGATIPNIPKAYFLLKNFLQKVNARDTCTGGCVTL